MGPDRTHARGMRCVAYMAATVHGLCLPVHRATADGVWMARLGSGAVEPGWLLGLGPYGRMGLDRSRWHLAVG